MEAAVRAIAPTPVGWELLHPSLVAEAPPSWRQHEAPGEGDTRQAADRRAPRDPGESVRAARAQAAYAPREVSGYLYAPCVALRAAPCAARAPVKAPRPTRSRAGRWRAWAWSRCTSRAPAR